MNEWKDNPKVDEDADKIYSILEKQSDGDIKKLLLLTTAFVMIDQDLRKKFSMMDASESFLEDSLAVVEAVFEKHKMIVAKLTQQKQN
jgi:hypothetical protein